MKWVAIFAVLVSLISGATLVRKGVVDEVIFTRVMQDLRELSPEDVREYAVWDPWGNPYRVATTTSGDSSLEYIFSSGPDGRSESLGQDPDDITVWTSRSTWVATPDPAFWLRATFGFGVLALVGVVSFILGRSRRGKS